MEERIIELELKYTEQQAALQALSEVVYAQAKALDQLTARVAQLSRRLEAEPGLVDAQLEERPPHY